jgi:hypothetical protein
MWRMARFAALLSVLLLVLAPTASREATPLLVQRQASPLLGLTWGDRGAALVAVDPRLLEPVAGRRISFFGAGAWAYSPDRTRLALAARCQVGGGLSWGITVVDVERLRARGCLWLDPPGAMVWSEPRRLLAVTGDEVVSIDPVRLRILARSPLPTGQLVAKAASPRGLVLLYASEGVGRLVVIDEAGTARSVPLDLPAGVQPAQARLIEPGLALDPTGRRAFVVTSAGFVAEVALDTLAVVYRELHENVSLLGRLAAWLQPAAQAKELPQATRIAFWLGNGMLAVAGTTWTDGRARPAGLSIVDTRAWSVRELDPTVSDLTVSQGRIVAHGPSAGVVVYDLGGRLLYRRFAGRSAWINAVYGGRIYATVDGVRVLDLATGKQVGRRALAPPRLLLGRSG